MKFSEIKQLTTMGGYRVDVMWGFLEETLNEYKEGWGLDMNPDFQRGHVWDEIKQKRYVEFILRGGHSAKEIYFNCSHWNGKPPHRNMVLIDGKQRIEAVLKFLRNELAIFDGRYFKDYDGRLRINARFVFYVNDLPDRVSELQWYLDLNTGGVVHTNKEIEKVKQLLEFENKKIEVE